MKQLFLLILCALLLPLSVYATTDTVGDLQVTADHPLFPGSIVWYPGLTVSKTISITNIGTTSHMAYIDTSNSSQTGDIADILLFSVFNNSLELFGGAGTKSMHDFWSNGRLTVNTLVPGSSTDVQFTVTMPDGTDNIYQQTTAAFDLRTGFAGTGDQVVVVGGAPPAGSGDGLSDGRSDGLSDGKSDGKSLTPAIYGETGEEILGLQTQGSPEPTSTQNGKILRQQRLWLLILVLLIFPLWIVLKKRRKS